MKLTSILLLVGSAVALASSEDQVNQRFTVEPGGKVTVDVEFGSVDVKTSNDPVVIVDAWRKISRKSKADEEAYLRDHPIEVTQDGANVTVRARGKVEGRTTRSFFGRGNQNEARYTLTIPAKFNVQLKTSGGPITVSDLTGETRANTSGGALRFEHLHGPIDANTSGGAIHVTASEGPMKVHTSGGGIDIIGGSGSVEAGTSGGPIKVKDFTGPIHVNTSGGGISVEDVTGELHGSTSGGSIHASLGAPLGETTRLTTSGGGITVNLPKDSAFDLDAATSAGSVHSEFAVDSSGKPNRSHLKGPVNGGGKSVYLRTSAGSIEVKQR
jgi:DUF4097 and DUF4098 domain-containing protein YvlB